MVKTNRMSTVSDKNWQGNLSNCKAFIRV